MCHSQEEIDDYMNDDARLFKQPSQCESDSSSCCSEVQSTRFVFSHGKSNYRDQIGTKCTLKSNISIVLF